MSREFWLNAVMFAGLSAQGLGSWACFDVSLPRAFAGPAVGALVFFVMQFVGRRRKSNV